MEFIMAPGVGDEFFSWLSHQIKNRNFHVLFHADCKNFKRDQVWASCICNHSTPGVQAQLPNAIVGIGVKYRKTF